MVRGLLFRRPSSRVPIQRTQSWVPPGEELICPISREMMTDPVIASDGHTYDRKSMEEYFSKESAVTVSRLRSPMTNEILVNRTLISNHAIRALILEYHRQYDQNKTQDSSLARENTKARPFQSEFPIFVQDLKSQSRTMYVRRDTTIECLMETIHQKTGIAPENQRLLFGGKNIRSVRDSGHVNTIADYNLVSGNTIHLVERLRGGGNSSG